MIPTVYVDARYTGNHGIARYAGEVVPRLRLDWKPMSGTYRPGSPRDVLDRQRMLLPPWARLYNPGYTAGPTRALQLLTIHDLTHLREGGARGRAMRLYYDRIVRPAIRKTGHVLTVSDVSAREIRTWLGSSAVQVHNAGNGCSEIFAEDHGEASFKGVPYFMFVGNFKAHKNPAPLFAAMRRFPHHLLVVVSADGASATELASANGIADRVRVCSGVDDVTLSKLYRGASALVFPSTWEGFGLPVVEALTVGTNVVYAARAESVVEICGGLQFPVSDSSSPTEFAKQMENAAGSAFSAPPGLQRYRWDAVAAQVEAVIKSIC